MESRRVLDYFVMAGMPEDASRLHALDEHSLEVNLKPSAYQDPITDITVIFPGLGETIPDYYHLVETTPTGMSANLNHGSFRAPEVFLCYRRGRHVPPLVDVGVFYEGKERVLPDSQIVEFTPNGHVANVNNTTNSCTFLTYRRSTEMSPCNELVVMDVCVIIKGEDPPHSFMKIDKTLNKGMMGADVYLCYKKSMNRADLISYKPCLLSRFPLANVSAYSLEETVALFCLPMGATLECWPASAARTAAVTSSFVLTLANRNKVYGSAITFYEEHDEDLLTEKQKVGLQLHKYRRREERKILHNKCICVLSQWPFYEAFEKLLFFLHKRQLMGPFDVPIERFIAHFLYDVPFPSPARPRILIQLDKVERIALSQPEELPLPRCGAFFRSLLLTLGPDNSMLLLLLALAEHKILLHSHRPSLLTGIAEAVVQIIFPLVWQCPYIPLCPIGMADYLTAPLPFVIGLDSRFFDLYDPPADVSAVDLDTGTITLGFEKRRATMSTKLLPKRAAKQLRADLQALYDKCTQHESMAVKLAAQMDDTAIDFDFTLKRREMQLELEIREAFLRFNVGVLAGYRHFLLPITSAPTVGATDVQNLFDQSGFLRSRDKNFHKFYELLMRTQMFAKFIEERSFVSETNTCLAFFDECVEKKDEAGVRFLEQEGVESDRTVFILPPQASDFPEDVALAGDENGEFHYDTLLLDARMCPDRPHTAETDSASCPHTEFQTPASAALAKRTKQEIRSAQKLARRIQKSPYLWAKCLISTSYSLWFIHLPGLAEASRVKTHKLRAGFSLLQRMQKLRLHPADEICYRVMMQLCGVYNEPSMAVKVLSEMRRLGVSLNAVTYGYYNKAVLESVWQQSDPTSAQKKWSKLANVVLAMRIFKDVGKNGGLLVRNERGAVVVPTAGTALSAAAAAALATAAVSVAENRSAEAASVAKDETDSASQTSSEDNNIKAPSMQEEEELELVSDQVDNPECEKKAAIEICSEHKEEEEANPGEVERPNGHAPGPPTEESKGLFRQRLPSIVKPLGSGLLEEQEDLLPKLEEEPQEKPTSPNEGTPATSPVPENMASANDVTPSRRHFSVSGHPSKSAEKHPKRRLSFQQSLPESNCDALDITFEHRSDDLGVTSIKDLKMDSFGQDKHLLLAGAQSRREPKPKLMPPLEETVSESNAASSVSTASAAKSYSDIRGKYPHLFHNNKGLDSDPSGATNVTKKVNRSLFRSESTESSSVLEQQVMEYMEHRGGSQSRNASEGPEDISEGTESRRSQSSDSLMDLESAAGSAPSSSFSPAKRFSAPAAPVTTAKTKSLLTPPPPTGYALQKVASSNSIMASLVGTPVTENDPLGALSHASLQSESASPIVGSLSKSNTSPAIESPPVTFIKPDDNILGSPFSSDKLARSSTLPADQSDSTLATPNSGMGASSFASLRNLTKVGSVSVGSRISSLKKSSSYITSYLSPSPATSKKTQEALSHGITSIRSAYASVSKRVEEIRDSVQNPVPSSPGVSPATSSQYLATPDHAGRARDARDDDAVSNSSDRGESSRRASAVAIEERHHGEQFSDTWSSLTGALWEQFWGGDGSSGSSGSGSRGYYSASGSLNSNGGHVQPATIKPSDIIERFEDLYSRLPKRPAGPVGLEVQMTSCSRCLYCTGILFDEEIMAGWTAEDSNLNTLCPFCERLVVPFLTIRLIDFRTRSLDQMKSVMASRRASSQESLLDAEQEPTEKENGAEKSNDQQEESVREDNYPPHISEPITIPYLSPLVLRKELENMLETEGDLCLVDAACVDSHPIIFWNLLWYFERIAVRSHLPGLCLRLPTEGYSTHESWAAADHRNVYILCRWDNERLHENEAEPLYTQWRSHNNAAEDSGVHVGQPRRMLVLAEKQNEEVRAIMQQVIFGVQVNDLVQPLKSMLERRSQHDSGRRSTPTSPKSSSPSMAVVERTPRSVYREMLFLTLVSLGQDNIDLTAFDREYRRAFEKLPAKYDALVHRCDRPPTTQTLFCRKLFRELRL